LDKGNDNKRTAENKVLIWNYILYEINDNDTLL